MFCSLHMSPLPCRCQTPRGPYCSPVPGRMLEREEICSCDRLRVGHGEGPGIALGIEHCVVLVAPALCRGMCDHSFLYICAPSWGWQPCLFPCFSQVGSPIAWSRGHPWPLPSIDNQWSPFYTLRRPQSKGWGQSFPGTPHQKILRSYRLLLQQVRNLDQEPVFKFKSPHASDLPFLPIVR